MTTRTPGPWDFACDSYGKVQHSKKACVYSTLTTPDGDRLETIAARIPNWADAKLIAAAPELLEALRMAEGHLAEDLADVRSHPIRHCPVLDLVRAAIAKAGG